MKLGLVTGLGEGGRVSIDMERLREAEELGFDSIWTSEAWGSDAISTASWILAQTTKIKVGTGIIQMSARTPAMAAMTAMSLQHLSNDRFILGIGPSGPQVIEGWHGMSYSKPAARIREYVEILHKIWDRQEPVALDGKVYLSFDDDPDHHVVVDLATAKYRWL